MPKQKGFTLMELLVVIAIIGLLATIVLVSANSVRGKARNVRRISDMRSYVIAFEMAYDENNEYPDPGDTSWHCLGDYSDDGCWSNNNWSESSVLNDILDEWIKSLPADENIICGPFGVCVEGYLYKCTSRVNNVCLSIEVRWIMEKDNQYCGIGTDAGYRCDNCTYCHVVL